MNLLHLRRRLAERLLLASVVAIAASLLAVCSSALASTAAPGWTISSVAEPANFSSEQNAVCEAEPQSLPGETPSIPCDSYRVIARNVGSASSNEPITIVDMLPAGVEAIYAALQEKQAGASVFKTECALAPIHCEYSEPVAPGGELIVTINVKILSSAQPLVLNYAAIEGGGLAHPLTTSEPTTEPNTVNGATPAFDIKGSQFRVDGLDGVSDPQAGDHPYAVTTSFHIPNMTRFDPSEPSNAYNRVPVGMIKGLIVDLPPGLVGDPQVTPRCPLTALQENYVNETSTTNCPLASRVGTVTFESEGIFHASNTAGGNTSSIFNMVPEAGYPAEFGFSFLGKPVLMYASTLPSASGYGLRVSVPSLIAVPVEGISLTFFGNPAQQDGGATSSAAFLTNPMDCASGPLSARIEADSWEDQVRWVSHESTTYPELIGCNMLQFQPMIEAAPEVSQADTPSGYEVVLRVPQTPNVSPVLAMPEIRNASVTLPEGVSVSPGAADGLVGCKEGGAEGIELGNKDALGHTVEEGEEAGAGGLPRAAHGHCPQGSQIGTVEIETPLLPPHSLSGHLYLAQPKCGVEGQPSCTESSASNGELFGLYLEAEGEGVIIKLKGEVSANPATGQLTTRFEENPQLPFSDLKLRLNGGQRAPLATPQTCGTATTTSDLEPWSAPESGPNATPSSSFPVSGCANPMGLAPGFSAGTVTPLAGGFTPFTMTLSRKDGEQNLGGVSLTMPPGVAGMLSKVPVCGEPQAQAGTCPETSRIGTTNVAAGAGSEPLWLPGRVYLTGPYKGSPFGLSIVVPAKAGPFNLGNVVVRSAINVDPRTAQVTVTSDPLPQIRDGVPFRLKAVNVTIDRSEFVFNPTNCSPLHVTGTVSGDMPDGTPGSTVGVSSPFAVAGCKNLPFHPSFRVSTGSRSSRANGASLDVKVGSSTGQANIQKVHVSLPKQLPSRLSTLKQACPDSVFNVNPAACPTGSKVGGATAITPILAHPLTGPAYLVSHGGAAFPDLEVVLQGEGITLILDGKTNIKKGITTSSFDTVPDAPISSFELKLPVGAHSALGAPGGNLCAAKLGMPTSIAGQNGAVVKQSTKIAVTGCAKHKKAKHKKAKHKKAKHKKVKQK